MNIAIIAARGGSSRIKKKNIKPFRGKPIIYYSIKAAINSKCFDRIIVSTDDKKIAQIAKNYGAEVPFLRTKKLAKNSVSNREVIVDVLKRLNLKKIPDYVCQIFATAPFLRPTDLNNSLKILKSNKSAEFCFSVVKFPHPIQRAMKITKNGRVKMFQPKFRKWHSQNLIATYHDAGQFYWGKTNSIIKNKITFSQISLPYILPRFRTIDIDEPEDWKQAILMSKSLFD